MGKQLIARADGANGEALSEESRAMRDREQQALLDEAQWEARCLIVDHRELLDELARLLLANETLEREEVELVLSSARSRQGLEERFGPAGESSEPAELAASVAVQDEDDGSPPPPSRPASEPPPAPRPSKPPPGVIPIRGPRFSRDGDRSQRPPSAR
jgi:hypothetical protein